MFLFLLWPSLVLADVQALFNLETPIIGPFPSDRFTVADSSQLTGRRVNLPLPDCAVHVSDCEDLNVINTLDGFNMQPGLVVAFDGAIDVTTVTSQTLFLIKLGSAVRSSEEDANDDGSEGCEGGGCASTHHIIGINQVVWDPFANTLHVESDELLEQDTRYALIATRGILDTNGFEVQSSEAFRNFPQTVRDEYKRDLLSALHAARQIGVPEKDVVTASVFSTQSATAVMEKIRDQIHASTPAPADFRLGPGGERTVFPLDEIAGITWRQQRGDNPPTFTEVPVNFGLLAQISPGAVGVIAFGKYNSPDYEVHPGEFIPPIGTRTGAPLVQGANQIYFTLFLPSGSKPAGGWPVAIFGHGAGQSKDGPSFKVAATMAAHGIATIAINVVGHGFGPLGTLRVSRTSGELTFSSGGRGRDQDGDHRIDGNEGVRSARPWTINFNTDGLRQTAADLMQLVRVIEVGMDVDGYGYSDLDPSRIYYFGNSLGSMYGTIFLAAEPNVQAGVLTSIGAPILDTIRLSPVNRSMLGTLLASRIPSLLNAPGISSLDGVATGPPRFNENFPLRDGIPLHVRLVGGTSEDIIQSPVSNTVAGAFDIQQIVKNTEWVTQQGSPVAFAPHLRSNPLAGMTAKSVICQFAKGDQTAANPYATQILRAGNLADRATFYRHDVAYAEILGLPRNPHGFMVSTDVMAFRPISLAAQGQIATFFESDGTTIIQPEPERFFEVPIVLPLPEDLNFIPDP